MAAKKNAPSCVLCGATKEITFEGDSVQYPVFSCPTHGTDKRNEWAIWFEKYKDDWRDDKAWDESNRKLSCLVGYFCYKFSEFYGRPFVFGYENPIPFKSKEFVFLRRVLTMFGQNAREARVYIKWVFAKRVKSTKYTISSVGFFASSKFVNEYLQAKARSGRITRTTKLPNDFVEWCRVSCPEIFDRQELETWNDLNGLVTYVQSYGLESIEGKVVLEAINRKLLPEDLGYARLEK